MAIYWHITFCLLYILRTKVIETIVTACSLQTRSLGSRISAYLSLFNLRFFLGSPTRVTTQKFRLVGSYTEDRAKPHTFCMLPAMVLQKIHSSLSFSMSYARAKPHICQNWVVGACTEIHNIIYKHF